MRLRAVAAGAASLVAIAGLLVSVGWREGSSWTRNNPVDAAEVAPDGSATQRGVTIRFDGLDQVDRLTGRFGDALVPPEGWTLWVAGLEVSGVTGTGFSVEAVVVASDGTRYTRSDRITFDHAPEEGWFAEFLIENGTWTDAFLLPEDVEPVRLELVPTDVARNYWSFDV
ncbi:hypothetical protein C8046_13965 [Serinibacter arcticus]|uniref:Uncharacterized protein n=1 Tax=Serinibacter arcticus TaxID=1655435 RepID=A0A2U1ZX95_9MICO|nr:hypothetical protein [Serinibacter arcticus]PWD51584.1 hypothetical protein C8046_13965 [Serinibacter arcticus]